MKHMFLIVLGWIVVSFAAHAASFDCGKAATKVERLICSDAAISTLDDELAATYRSALQNKTQAESIRQTQKQWLTERNGCAEPACVKRSYEERLLSLRAVISISEASSDDSLGTKQGRDTVSVIVPIACRDEDRRGKPNIRPQDIAGLYRESVEGRPAYVGHPEEKRSGYNYLAITHLVGSRLRVRLSTKEINGHDCGFDSEALLCGRTIRLIPNATERSALDIRKLPVPSLRVSANQIAFIPDASGSFVWGTPYCGAMGYLRQGFSRNTRKLKFVDAIFNRI